MCINNARHRVSCTVETVSLNTILPSVKDTEPVFKSNVGVAYNNTKLENPPLLEGQLRKLSRVLCNTNFCHYQPQTNTKKKGFSTNFAN